MIKEIRLRCDSREQFIAWMVAKGMGELAGPPRKGNELDPPEGTFIPKPGVQWEEIGPIVQVPAVMKPGTFEVQTPAIVDPAFHVDLRIVDVNYYTPSDEPDVYEMITEGKAQTTEVIKNSKVEVVAATADDATTLMDAVATTELTARMVNGIKQAAGTRDDAAGVAIINPSTPRHVWC